ncbi:MAG: hypothetical protein LBU40_00850 [Methanobrevibacter sp.]|jgi:hypothetical protein|nr:hypothetical protein [Methanobrevibacter sp.]
MDFNLEKIMSIAVFIVGIVFFEVILGIGNLLAFIVIIIWAILFGFFWKRQFMS